MNRHMYFRQQEKNYLMHHGIKGQKWGIRRFQNEDGSLTPEGRARYGMQINNDKKKGNFKKQVKNLQKETMKARRSLGDASYGVAYDLAITKEYEDRKKFANNKKFKKDLEEAARNYDKIDDYSTASEFEEDTRRLLQTKYPEAYRLLEGLTFGENNWMSIEDRFNNQKLDVLDRDEPYYYSWLDNVLNNDFYYEPDDFMDEANAIVLASAAESDKELKTKYGKDVVDAYLAKEKYQIYDKNGNRRLV